MASLRNLAPSLQPHVGRPGSHSPPASGSWFSACWETHFTVDSFKLVQVSKGPAKVPGGREGEGRGRG